MEIKGIKGGSQKGEPIEYTPQEKVPIAIQKALALDGIGHQGNFDGQLVMVDKDSVKLDKFNYNPKGEPLKDKWQHNNYSAEGEVLVRLRNIESDFARKPRKIKFRTRFHDILDGWGQPDLTVTDFELIK